jgi:hypothetical protein
LRSSVEINCARPAGDYRGPEPPKYSHYVLIHSPAAPPRKMSNPEFSAWGQARHSTGQDRATVKAYEAFADAHRELYEYCGEDREGARHRR